MRDHCIFGIASIYIVFDQKGIKRPVHDLGSWDQAFPQSQLPFPTVSDKKDARDYFNAGFEYCLLWFRIASEGEREVWDYDRVKFLWFPEIRKKNESEAFFAGLKFASDKINEVLETQSEAEVRSKMRQFSYRLAFAFSAFIACTLYAFYRLGKLPGVRLGFRFSGR